MQVTVCLLLCTGLPEEWLVTESPEKAARWVRTQIAERLARPWLMPGTKATAEDLAEWFNSRYSEGGGKYELHVHQTVVQ
jgi:hypothetical protein